MSEDRENEHLKLFIQEASENVEELNRQLITLEKDPKNTGAINSIFRIVHTAKGNAMAMGLDPIAKLSHAFEDVISEAKQGNLVLDPQIFDSLFRAADKLNQLLNAVGTDRRISYAGIKTKLEVLLKNNLKQKTGSPQQETAALPEDLPTAEAAEEDSPITFTDFIQMPVKKMDEILNLVGQLVIERDQLLTKYGSSSDLNKLKRITSDLQYSVLKARMIPASVLLKKFYIIARDAAAIEKKKVLCEITGADIEIDRNVLRAISDSMVHIVRNAVSHGIESTEDRLKLGKVEQGRITLEARAEKNNVLIRVTDDGAGIDPEKLRAKLVAKNMLSEAAAHVISDHEVIMQIFQPGFSSADAITAVSGRGIGMDVVKKSVESIGGQVAVDTRVGAGTTINMFLPYSLSIKSALLFQVNGQEYAILLSFTESVRLITKKDFHFLNSGLVVSHLNRTVPVVFMDALLQCPSLNSEEVQSAMEKRFESVREDEAMDLIVVSYSGRRMALVVDHLMSGSEIMEKPLPKSLGQVALIHGAAILANGNVGLVVDIAAINKMLYSNLATTNV